MTITSSQSSKFCLLLWRVEGFEGFKALNGLKLWRFLVWTSLWEVLTLQETWWLMGKIECAEMCCNCAEKCCKCAEMLQCCKCAANMLKTCCKCATIVLKCSDSANMLQMCCKRVANVLQLRWNVLELQMYCKCATIVLKCSGTANVLKCYRAS